PTFGPMMVARGKSTRGHGRREQFVLEAVETIRREACDGLTAASLIARFPVSKRLFNLRFREAMGHSPLDEIMQVRMEKVLSLLSGTDTPVGAIADMCGFGSAVELRQIFRARTGISMTEWRARRA
ncbi:MAG: helix-turn-helix transcriptional regulator, partial [Kiritimatiellae bacterium]|nr:helix-turn-helix transcriptional regulator [Kiritimatiellia bacterium]